MRSTRSSHRRQEAWKLTLNLSLCALIGGLAFALIGAWPAAWITFAFGTLCALAAGLLLRRREPRAPAAEPRARERTRRPSTR